MRAAPVVLLSFALVACGASSLTGVGGSGGSAGAGGRGPLGTFLGAAGSMLTCVSVDDAGVASTGSAGAGGSGAPGACVTMPSRMPVGRMGIATATAPDGLIYLISWQEQTTSDCRISPLFAYDPRNDSYRSLASPPVDVGTVPAAAFAAGKLVMIFGDTYLYDPATDLWSRGSTSPGGQVLDALTATLDDRVYVIGGQDAYTSNLAQTYDPATDQWAALPPAPAGGYGAAAVRGKIYIVGLTASVLDPVLGTWTDVTPPSHLRINPNVIADGAGNLLVIGGFNLDGTLASVESFSPLTGVWTERAPLPIPTFLGGAASGCDGTRIFVFGGDAGHFVASPHVQVYGPGDSWRRSL